MNDSGRFQIIGLGNAYDFVIKDHYEDKTYGTFQGEKDSMKRFLNDLNSEENKINNLNEKITELTKYKIMVDLLEDSLSSRDVRSMIVNRYSKFETFEDVDAEIEKRLKVSDD